MHEVDLKAASRTRLQTVSFSLILLLAFACGGSTGSADRAATSQEDDLARRRATMVEDQLLARGIRDKRVLEAMRTVRRHRYVPGLDATHAYDDRPYPIGEGQTISQPYIVALMSELANLDPPCRVLEIGTGSGYQAAVLAEMGCDVYSIELIESLGIQARKILDGEGYGDRVQTRIGDGYAGWPEHAPFDAVVVTAAAPRVPQPLLDQLRIGGRLVIPVGVFRQELEVHTRRKDGFKRKKIVDVRFVPMLGEVREAR